jgi:hypothetical protein
MTVAGVVVVAAAAAVVVVVEAVVVEISFHCCCFQRPQREQQAHQAVGRKPDGQFYKTFFSSSLTLLHIKLECFVWKIFLALQKAWTLGITTLNITTFSITALSIIVNKT